MQDAVTAHRSAKTIRREARSQACGHPGRYLPLKGRSPPEYDARLVPADEVDQGGNERTSMVRRGTGDVGQEDARSPSRAQGANQALVAVTQDNGVHIRAELVGQARGFRHQRGRPLRGHSTLLPNDCPNGSS